MNKPPHPKIAVVIPCFRVSSKITEVVTGILGFADQIYVIDDCCPEGSGGVVERNFAQHLKVAILRTKKNLGVGGAVITGYQKALADGAEIIVKIDGDGQMDAGMIPAFTNLIASGQADYAKGNRFFSLSYLHSMPTLRLFGNAVLSFVSKASSGYWHIMDPTNGFTAVHRNILLHCDLEKLQQRYFFESDMLFRLNTIRAKIIDVPIPARYEAGNHSSLGIGRTVLTFPALYVRNFLKRIFYSYFLRDFNLGSLALINAMIFLLFGVSFGAVRWYQYASMGQMASAGTVMLAALSVMIGVLSIFSFANFDVMNVPQQAVHDLLPAKKINGYSD